MATRKALNIQGYAFSGVGEKNISKGGTSPVPFGEEITNVSNPNVTTMHVAGLTPMTETGQAEANLLNLLIVDDERAIRDGCREIAQTLGFSTLVADDTIEAAHLLETSGADVVLLDLRLPGGSGLELLRESNRRSRQ
jgi:PleD family two-component response regulator